MLFTKEISHDHITKCVPEHLPVLGWLGGGGNRHSGEAPTQYCPRSFQIGTAGAATIVAAGLAARLGEQRTGRRQQVSVDTGTAADFRARSYSYPEKGPRTRRDLKAPGNAPARVSGRGGCGKT